MSKDEQLGVEVHNVIPKSQVLVTKKLDFKFMTINLRRLSIQPDNSPTLPYCIHVPSLKQHYHLPFSPPITNTLSADELIGYFTEKRNVTI